MAPVQVNASQQQSGAAAAVGINNMAAQPNAAVGVERIIVDINHGFDSAAVRLPRRLRTYERTRYARTLVENAARRFDWSQADSYTFSGRFAPYWETQAVRHASVSHNTSRSQKANSLLVGVSSSVLPDLRQQFPQLEIDVLPQQTLDSTAECRDRTYMAFSARRRHLLAPLPHPQQQQAPMSRNV